MLAALPLPMPFSTAIAGIILIYIWLLAPVARGAVRALPVVLVIGLTVWHAVRTGEWGFRRDALLPGLVHAVWTTAIGAALLLAAGDILGTLHPRRGVGRDLAFLVFWGGGQQLALQTVLLHEARRVMSRRAAIVVAAAVFGAIHLPNPFLAPATFTAALVWCWIYSRHPNILPLALSHAVATVAVLHAFDAEITGRLRIGYAYLQFVWGE
jgi:membrane protease YdiL (CAAX protease family)